ncbi:MAG: GNAT family N-acetyltransferase [Paracoccaceae bacterium]
MSCRLAIRRLDPATDRDSVSALLAEAQDYYRLWLGHSPGADETDAVFSSAPPGCDPDVSHRLGLYLGDSLSGVAEFSFGFPEPGDAYLGLMILAPRVRSRGHGAAFLAHLEGLAQQAKASKIYLAVLEENPRGAAFWVRMGFTPTGLSRHDATTGHTLHRLVKPL